MGRVSHMSGEKWFSTSRMLYSIVLTVIVAYIGGCASLGVKRSVDTGAVEAKFFTEKGSQVDRSSVSFFHGSDGSHLAYAPQRNADRIVIFDAEKGTEIERYGASGSEKGQFMRPVDTVVADELLFVLEQGNHRIQVFHLPDMESFGFFGEEHLTNPSHIALYRIELGAFYIYAADSVEFAGETQNHILRFSVSRGVNTIHGTYLRTFGYTPENGYLDSISSLEIDQTGKRVLVGTGGRTRAYTLDGDSAR